jgi:GNAT superfamily N-acetyltransferase
VELRPITSADNAALKQVVLACLAEYGLGGEGTAAADPELADMAGFVAQHPHANYWVLATADEQGQPVVVGGGGWMHLKGTPLAEGKAEMIKFYLLPPYRRQGWGQRLLALAEAEAKQAGFTWAYAETIPAMKSVPMLQKHGYSVLNERWGSTGHSQLTVWLAKPLA